MASRLPKVTGGSRSTNETELTINGKSIKINYKANKFKTLIPDNKCIKESASSNLC